MATSIPSNFDRIARTIREMCPDFSGTRVLRLTDALMETLPRPAENVCLCACNQAWIPCPGGKPETTSDGHGWDNCEPVEAQN